MTNSLAEQAVSSFAGLWSFFCCCFPRKSWCQSRGRPEGPIPPPFSVNPAQNVGDFTTRQSRIQKEKGSTSMLHASRNPSACLARCGRLNVHLRRESGGQKGMRRLLCSPSDRSRGTNGVARCKNNRSRQRRSAAARAHFSHPSFA